VAPAPSRSSTGVPAAGAEAGGGRARPAARLFIALVVLAGLGCLAVRLPEVARWTATDAWTCLVLVALSVALEQFQFRLPYGTSYQVFSLVDAVWVAALLAAPPSVLTVTVAAGMLLGQALQARPFYRKAFNLGQHLIGITIAQVIYASLSPGDPTRPAAWGAAAAAMGALYLFNEVAIAGAVSLTEGAAFWRLLVEPWRLTLVNWAGSLAIGLLGGVLWARAPLTIPLLLIPLALSYLAHRGWQARLRERDQMRHITHTANAIAEQGDLTRRVAETQERNEAGLLVATINRMLDQIEAAFERERQFISEASHELRTPLTICRGHLEVLGADPPPQEVREVIGVVVGELERMGRIVQDMATLARTEHPEFLRPEPVRVDRFVDELAATAAPLLDGRLRTQPARSDAVLWADPQRLTQALLNLLRNAAVHAPGDTPVDLRVTGEPEGIRFEVSDRGGGLPPGEEDGVFQPFRRLNTAAPGTGLGLAIVRGIAEAHGGQAGARNRPGYGVTFWLSVPWR
jgi:signal transduction histidine kinase